MGFRDWYDQLSEGQRTTYGLLLSVILLTIPCYCLGVIALVNAPPPVSLTPTPLATMPPRTNTPPAVAPPTLTFTPRDVTITLEPTPTQFFPTVVPSATASETPTPTETLTPIPSDTPPSLMTGRTVS